jgi:hypothetical protein
MKEYLLNSIEEFKKLSLTGKVIAAQIFCVPLLYLKFENPIGYLMWAIGMIVLFNMFVRRKRSKGGDD